MSLQKMALLLQKLEKLTLSGNLDWEPTEKDNVFQTSFPNFSVRIYPEEEDYVISIFNSEGLLLESVTDPELSDILKDSFSRMKALYESSRGYALGTEKVLDDILNELDKKDLDIPF